MRVPSTCVTASDARKEPGVRYAHRALQFLAHGSPYVNQSLSDESSKGKWRWYRRDVPFAVADRQVGHHLRRHRGRNASSGLYVLGDRQVQLSDLEPVDAQMEMRSTARWSPPGDGTACLGRPARGAGLAGPDCRDVGTPQHAGQVVLSAPRLCRLSFGATPERRAGVTVSHTHGTELPVSPCCWSASSQFRGHSWRQSDTGC